MSVATDKQRIEWAKTGLASWLTENGVTVPSGAKLDALVDLLSDVEAGGATDMKKWTVTVASDSSSSGNIMVSADPWIAQHYNDERLNIYIRAESLTNGEQQASLAVSQSSNTKIPNCSSNYYGVKLYCGTGTTTLTTTPNSLKLASSGSNVGAIHTTSNGDITLGATTAAYLRAGTYSVVAWLM